ncbi:MAG: GDSL-type esterase/lipase family protein [Rikenellaceae bacterium]
MRRVLSLLILALVTLPLSAATITSDETITYKQTEQGDLNLEIFYPNDTKKGKKRVAIISFFGGGWSSGSTKHFYEQSEYYASLGIVAITPEYRISSRHKTTPFEAVMDAKSAVRWVRQHSKELGIDPNKIIVSGGSAGGHLAACTGTIEGCDEDAVQKVSSKPNALILFNPVSKTTKDGYGSGRVVGRETEISPVHHIKRGVVPTLILHGTHDTTVPYANSVEFAEKMLECGNECRLVSAFGENHGFFNGSLFRKSNGSRNFDKCMYETSKFLAEQGYISEDKVMEKPDPIRVACLGNSITFGARIENREQDCYPANLQRLLGDDYDVKNFGRSGATLLTNGNVPYIETIPYKALQEFGPDVVIIKLGTNDSKGLNWDSHSAEFEADYKALIAKLKSNPARKAEVILCSPMPAFLKRETFTGDSQKMIDDSVIINHIYPIIKKLAKGNKSLFIDAYHPFVDRADLFPDKIHPGAEGAKMLAELIYNCTMGKK